MGCLTQGKLNKAKNYWYSLRAYITCFMNVKNLDMIEGCAGPSVPIESAMIAR